MWIAFLLLFISLAFIVRFCLAPFSPKIRNQIRENHLLHFLGGMFAFLYCLFWLGLLNQQIWPPHWLELRRQRQIVAERVQAAGGWDGLRKDCDTLAQMNEDDSFTWLRLQPQTLPASIAALNPQLIRFYPKQWLPKDVPKLSVIQIKIFGFHRTGGHSTPFYGLDVVCEPGTNDFLPEPAAEASGNYPFHYRKLAENIYEIY